VEERQVVEEGEERQVEGLVEHVGKEGLVEGPYLDVAELARGLIDELINLAPYRGNDTLKSLSQDLQHL